MYSSSFAFRSRSLCWVVEPNEKYCNRNFHASLLTSGLSPPKNVAWKFSYALSTLNWKPLYIDKVLACIYSRCTKIIWAQENMRGEREHLPERTTKIVSHPLFNYLAALRNLSKLFIENRSLLVKIGAILNPREEALEIPVRSRMHFLVLLLKWS